MGNDKNFDKIFIKRVRISFQKTKKFKNGNLKERILDTSNFVLSVVLLSDHSINFTKSRNTVDNIFDKVLIKTDYILEESHGTEKDTMIFLIETAKNFWQKLRNIFGAFFNDSDGGENGFLSDVSAIVRNTL